MKLVLTFLCAGAVLFMLRFLAALLREERALSPRPISIYFAKFNPVKRRGELIIMNSRNDLRKSAVETDKAGGFHRGRGSVAEHPDAWPTYTQ